MAKKQSFGDKVGKKNKVKKNHIKVIRTGRAMKTGALRFYEEMICVPEGKDADVVVRELLVKED